MQTFSAICYLTGRDIHDGLGGKVPIGLISSNWGGTPVESWLPAAAIKTCGRDANEKFGAVQPLSRLALCRAHF